MSHTGNATIGDGRIVVDRLTKKFGGFTAVDDLSFSVDPGRITGFLGPNGAGKTTTLRMLLGLVQQTSGTATIGGHRYVEIRRPQRVVGSALEATGFHPGRTGRNHLMVLADTAGVDGRRVDQMLELVGIPAAANRRAGGYSMGMRQRLGLAAAMLGDPQVLLLDEPFAGMGVAESERMVELLLKIKPDHAMLLVEHDMDAVFALADVLTVMVNGQVIASGLPDAIRSDARVQAAYLGEEGHGS